MDRTQLLKRVLLYAFILLGFLYNYSFLTRDFSGYSSYENKLQGVAEQELPVNSEVLDVFYERSERSISTRLGNIVGSDVTLDLRARLFELLELRHKRNSVKEGLHENSVNSPLYFFPEENCVQFRESVVVNNDLTQNPHPDVRKLVISCRDISYRLPAKEFLYNKTDSAFIGIFSDYKKGKLRRQLIRSTWAKEQKGIFFIVGGTKYDDIMEEFETYHDIIWVTVEEHFESSSYKLLAFLHASKQMSLELSLDVHYIFKTDDSAYVNVDNLSYEMMKASKENNEHFIGDCEDDAVQPTSSIIFEKVPEHCIGSESFALSKVFMDCALSHSDSIVYQSRDDVAISMLAERCNIAPFHMKFGQLQDYHLCSSRINSTIVQYQLDELGIFEFHLALHEPHLCKVDHKFRSTGRWMSTTNK